MRKLLVAFVMFPLFFTIFSEGLAFRENEIFNDWATSYLVEKTGSPEGKIPEIEPEEDIKDRIWQEAAIGVEEILVYEIKYIRDTPRKRGPVVTTSDFYGKLYTTVSMVAYVVLAFAQCSDYWSTAILELEIPEDLEAEIEPSEVYAEWRQQRKEEIEELKILEELVDNPEESWDNPEELMNEILTYTLEDVPFYDRIFLRNWEEHTKVRAQHFYESYQQHMKEGDLARASANLFYLGAMKESQQNVGRGLDTFFDPRCYNFGVFVILEFGGLFLLSAAATTICFLLLFYRMNPVVLSGIPLGFLAVFFGFGYVGLGLFLLAGVAAVYLSYKLYKIPLNYKECARLSLKSGFVLFLAFYVVNTALFFVGFIQKEVGAGFASLSGEPFAILGLLTVIEILSICALNVVGGLLARKILFRTMGKPVQQ